MGNLLSMNSGLRYHGAVIPGAQTERRGDAGPVPDLLGGKVAPAVLKRPASPFFFC
jgi:hypothetical protein